MTEKTLSKANLWNFTGTAHWFRHPLARKIVYTEGVQHVVVHGGAYWLINEIVFNQDNPVIAAEDFQVWRLAVAADKTAILTCGDGNDGVVFKKQLDFTDFPLDEICFYVINKTILLPSEY